jgi:hypothetical protein
MGFDVVANRQEDSNPSRRVGNAVAKQAHQFLSRQIEVAANMVREQDQPKSF